MKYGKEFQSILNESDFPPDWKTSAIEYNKVSGWASGSRRVSKRVTERDRVRDRELELGVVPASSGLAAVNQTSAGMQLTTIPAQKAHQKCSRRARGHGLVPCRAQSTARD